MSRALTLRYLLLRLGFQPHFMSSTPFHSVGDAFPLYGTPSARKSESAAVIFPEWTYQNLHCLATVFADARFPPPLQGYTPWLKALGLFVERYHDPHHVASRYRRLLHPLQSKCETSYVRVAATPEQ